MSIYKIKDIPNSNGTQFNFKLFKIKLCTMTMHTLLGISLIILYMLKLSAGQG